MKKLIYILLMVPAFLIAQETRTQLKTYFETGDKPNEAQFASFIDSDFNLTDDNITDISGMPASLTANYYLKVNTGATAFELVQMYIVDTINQIIIDSSLVDRDELNDSIQALESRIGGSLSNFDTITVKRANIDTVSNQMNNSLIFYGEDSTRYDVTDHNFWGNLNIGSNSYIYQLGTFTWDGTIFYLEEPVRGNYVSFDMTPTVDDYYMQIYGESSTGDTTVDFSLSIDGLYLSSRDGSDIESYMSTAYYGFDLFNGLIGGNRSSYFSLYDTSKVLIKCVGNIGTNKTFYRQDSSSFIFEINEDTTLKVTSKSVEIDGSLSVTDTSVYNISYVEIDGGAEYDHTQGSTHPAAANGEVYAGICIPQFKFGNPVIVKQITVYYYTDITTDDWDFNLYSSDNDGTITSHINTDDIGNGETGNSFVNLLSSDLTLTDFNYTIELDVNNTNLDTDVLFYNIRIVYKNK